MPVYNDMSTDHNLDGRDRGSIPAVVQERERGNNPEQNKSDGRELILQFSFEKQ